MKTVAMVREALAECKRTVRNLSNELFELNQELIQCGAQMPDFVFESKTRRMEYVQSAYNEQKEALKYYEKQIVR